MGLAAFKVFQRGARGACDAKTCAAESSVTAIGNGGGDIAPIRCDRGAAGASAWKTITMGNYRTAYALRDALRQRQIWIGDLAAEMLRLPTFTLSAADTSITSQSRRSVSLDSDRTARPSRRFTRTRRRLVLISARRRSVRNCAFNIRIRSSASIC